MSPLCCALCDFQQEMGTLLNATACRQDTSHHVIHMYSVHAHTSLHGQLQIVSCIDPVLAELTAFAQCGCTDCEAQAEVLSMTSKEQ